MNGINQLSNGTETPRTMLKILRQDNKNISAFIENFDEGIIVTDENGNTVVCNPTAQNIFGPGIINARFSDWTTMSSFYYPESFIEYLPDQLPLSRALKNEKVAGEIIFVKNIIHPKGIHVILSSNPLKDSDGSIIGAVIMIRIGTKESLLENNLMYREHRLETMFKELPIPCYIWQYQVDDFILVDYNKMAEMFTEGNVKNYIKMKFLDVYNNSPSCKEIYSDLLKCKNERTNIHNVISYRFRSTDELKELEVYYTFIQPDSVLVIAEDISESNKALEKLKMVSNAVEQTADSVVITDSTGIIEYVNPAFEKTTGYDRLEVIGKTPRLLKSGQHDQSFYNNLWKNVLAGNMYMGTIINKKKNGDLYWSEQTISSMKDTNGVITKFVSVLKDVTELRNQQEQEFQMNIAKALQQRLLKSDFSLPGCDIAGKTYSAVKTCGDFYDFITFPDNCTGIIIGDVCGHGIGAAFIMAITRAYLRAFSQTESDPAKILNLINNRLVEDLDNEHFVTLTLVRFDSTNKLFDYASAGHIPSYLMNRAGETRYKIESTGIPLGIYKNYAYSKSNKISLSSEEMLVFLTDGVIESRGSNEIDFGVDKTLNFIKSNREYGSQELIENLYKEVRSFIKDQPQEDDITAIICKVK